MDTTNETSTALDTLRLLAEKSIEGYHGKRRPTWAPPLVIDGELLSAVRELGLLADDATPVARLWARFTDPKRGPVKCAGFELTPGTSRASTINRIVETYFMRDEWHTGPQWGPPKNGDPERVRRYELRCRSTELGAARIAEFAGRPDEQMRIGGALCRICACCGRPLVDPISLERGIGPECWGRGAR